MTADDVVATWKRLASPGSQALSAVGTYLHPGGVQKVDDMTVAFHLNQPVSNFPYLVSSTTYQAIILPAELQARHVHDQAADDRRVHAHQLHAGRRRDLRALQRLVGRHGAAGRRRRHLLHRGRGGGRRAARAARST